MVSYLEYLKKCSILWVALHFLAFLRQILTFFDFKTEISVWTNLEYGTMS